MGRACGGLLRARRSVPVTGVRIVRLVRLRLARRGEVGGVRHHAGHDGCLQPRGTEQREHHPGEGVLTPSDPTQAGIHALYLLTTGAKPYPHVTMDRKQKCPRTR